MDKHTPVLLDEAVAALNVRTGGRYVDSTFGFGGHSWEILKKGGLVLALDVEDTGYKEFEEKSDHLIFRQQNFVKLGQVLKEMGWERVDGVLYDLGMSSWQMASSGRGFSFSKNEPLDMRMDVSLGVTAADLLNALSEKDIYEILKNFGEEPRSYQLARAIAGASKLKPIKTTVDLVEALGTNDVKVQARVWQALRIAVNGELDNLRESLQQAAVALNSDGRLVVISFQSLEDRIVKTFGKTCTLVKPIGELVLPKAAEIEINNRARSAKMRIFARL